VSVYGTVTLTPRREVFLDSQSGSVPSLFSEVPITTESYGCGFSNTPSRWLRPQSNAGLGLSSCVTP